MVLKIILAEFGSLKEYYHIEEEISRGGYGTVYKAKVKDALGRITEKEVAIKAFFEHTNLTSVYSEYNFLKLMRGNPHSVQLLELFVDKPKCSVVTEYFPNDNIEVNFDLRLLFISTFCTRNPSWKSNIT